LESPEDVCPGHTAPVVTTPRDNRFSYGPSGYQLSKRLDQVKSDFIARVAHELRLHGDRGAAIDRHIERDGGRRDGESERASPPSQRKDPWRARSHKDSSISSTCADDKAWMNRCHVRYHFYGNRYRRFWVRRNLI